MGVLKNDVGRPSNKTIMIRNILKAMLVITVAGGLFVGGYLLNNKKADEETKTGKTKQEETIKENIFDKTQVTTKIAVQDYFPESDALDVYVYGKKLELNSYITKINKIDVIDDIAVLELGLIDSAYLVIVDMKGNILFNADSSTGKNYCQNYKSSECYDYKINNKTISFYVDSLGQDISSVCTNGYNKEALVEYELTYENGKLSSPKKLNTVTGKEYVNKHNIDCSVVANDNKNEKNFDKSQVTIKIAEAGYFPQGDALDVYVYGKKLDLGNYVVGVGKVDVIDDIAVMLIQLVNDDYFIIVDKNGTVLFDSNKSTGKFYCSSSKTSECYGYKISGKTITFSVDNLGQDISGICKAEYNNEVFVEYELTYNNGKLSSPKKLSSMIGKEYVNKHNIDCSVVK